MNPDAWPHWAQHLVIGVVIFALTLVGFVLLGACLIVLWGAQLIFRGWMVR